MKAKPLFSHAHAVSKGGGISLKGRQRQATRFTRLGFVKMFHGKFNRHPECERSEREGRRPGRALILQGRRGAP